MAASDSYFEGILAIKEGHGDILVRPESGNDKRFKVKDNTMVTRNGKPARYNGLKVSDSIQVKYDATNRKVIAIHAGGS